MYILNIYLVASLVIFLQTTKEYIDAYSHLFVVLSFVVLLVLTNHYSEVIETFVVSEMTTEKPNRLLFANLLEWMKNDYRRSKTKRTIDYVIKYFLLRLQNTDGDKT